MEPILHIRPLGILLVFVWSCASPQNDISRLPLNLMVFAVLSCLGRWTGCCEHSGRTSALHLVVMSRLGIPHPHRLDRCCPANSSRQQALLSGRMTVASAREIRVRRVVGQSAQELRKAALSRLVVAQSRRESGVAEGLRKTLSQGFARAGIIREPA